MMRRVAVDPFEQVAHIAFGIGGGAGGFVADTDKQLDAHLLAAHRRRDRAFVIAEVDARFIAIPA